MFKPIWKNLLEVPVLSGIITPILVIGTYSLYLFFLEFKLINFLYFVLGYIVFNILGITAGYHRYFCHKSFLLKSKWKQRFLLWAGTLAGQGSVILWTSLHRGYHHRHTDTINDPHSPIHGFWHSFILWLYRVNGEKINPKYAVELIRNKEIVFIHNHYTKIYLGFNLILFAIDINLLLFFSIMPSFITLITYNITNSLSHTRTLGYRNFDTKDNSSNTPWLFPFILGECWHNNHHANPGNFHFGSKISNKWWEFDPAGRFIDLIKER